MRDEMKAIQAFVAGLEFTGFESIEESAMMPLEGIGGGNGGCNTNKNDCKDGLNGYKCINKSNCSNTGNQYGCKNDNVCDGVNNASSCTGGVSGGGSGGGSNSIGFPGILF